MSDESICSDYEVIDKKDSSAWEELLATVRRIDQKTETQAINEQEQVQQQSPKDGTWQLEHYRTSARENRQYAESLNAQLYHAKQMIEHWEERGEMYEAHIDHLIEEVKDRQKELESTRAHIQFLQQREMMNYTRPGWRAEEDARVRHVLYELHWNIHSWAERYAVHSLEFFRDNVRNRGFFRNTVLHDLQDVAKIDLRTFRELPRPFLLVVGMLSKHLFTHIFKHPFFLLSESLQKTEQKPSCGRCLDDVYHELLKGQSNISLSVKNPHTNTHQGIKRTPTSSGRTSSAPSSQAPYTSANLRKNSANGSRTSSGGTKRSYSSEMARRK